MLGAPVLQPVLPVPWAALRRVDKFVGARVRTSGPCAVVYSVYSIYTRANLFVHLFPQILCPFAHARIAATSAFLAAMTEGGSAWFEKKRSR